MASIRNTVKQFEGSDDLAQAQRQAVRALADLGNQKAENFKLEIEQSLLSSGTDNNLYIPVSSILSNLIVVRAFSSQSSDVPEAVTSLMDKFLRGGSDSIKNGVSELISTSLNMFLGESSASTGNLHQYYIAVEGISFVRIDVRSWYLNVSASSIYKVMEKILVTTAYKSVVDFSKIDIATFFALYETQLASTKMTPEQILEQLDLARKVYERYNESLVKPIN